MSHKGHLVFDCDGTLISSQNSILEALRVLMAEIQAREVTIQEARAAYHPDMLTCAKGLGVDVSDQKLLERLSARWIELCQSVAAHGHVAYPGVPEMIKTLAERGHDVFVWTARDRRSTREIMVKLGLSPYILDMRCMDDTTPKPHPQGIVELVGDAHKGDVLVIGDSLTDIQGARAFGACSVAALWGDHVERDTLARAGADFFAHSPGECVEIIEKYLSGDSDA